MSTISIPIMPLVLASTNEAYRRVDCCDSDAPLSAYTYNLWLAILGIPFSEERQLSGFLTFIYAYDAARQFAMNGGYCSIKDQHHDISKTFLYAYLDSRNPFNYILNSHYSFCDTDYDATGCITSANDAGVTYTYDCVPSRCTYGETGLYYYGHRYYQPETGRWASRDPIGERGGWNLVAIVANNPACKIDFLGKFSMDSVTAAIRACLMLPTYAEKATCLEGLLGRSHDGAVNNVIRSIRPMLRCELIHDAYSAFQEAGKNCSSTTGCAALMAKVTAITGEVLGRRWWLAGDCDCIMPGSIRRGPDRARRNHQLELASKTTYLATCTARMISECAREGISDPHPDAPEFPHIPPFLH